MEITPFKKALLGIALVTVSAFAHASAATFVVTNTDDSGPGSLRDAIAQAGGNGAEDTIEFDPAVFNTPRTITLTSGEIVINSDGGTTITLGKKLTINGPGRDLLTITGNKASRIFFVSTGSIVAMNGMTLRDGNGVGKVLNAEGTSGGAIIAHVADLSLTNMVVRNNTVPSSGGALYLSGIKRFTLTNSLVTESFATVLGGGIYAPAVSPGGTVTLQGSIISNNSTDNQVGGVAVANGITTIENCLITGNKAGLASGGTNRVGGLSLFQTKATVTDTTISDNSVGAATGGLGGSYGGVYADTSSNAPIVFRRVTVSGNTAYSCCAGGGGGMYLRAGGGEISIIDSTISGNRAPSFDGVNFIVYGGGIMTAGGTGRINIVNTTLANNQVAGAGAAIANFSSDLLVVNSTIANNASSGLSSPPAYTGAGGILNAEDHNAVARIQNTIIAKNTSGSVAPDVGRNFVSNGYNIIGTTVGSTGFGAAGDQLGVDPLLTADGLQNNGGATLTLALQPGSPAIDKGKSADVSTDQRGVIRPTDDPSIANAEGGDGSDIGAYEIGAANGVAEKTLGNISTRLPVLTGENVLIGGIIIVGDVPKRVVIRALGPSLAAVGVAGTLDDPTLELYQGDTLLVANHNWKDEQEGEIAGTGVAPNDDREAAIVRTLDPGNYTAVIRGNGDTTGVALIEAYDLDQRPNSKLGNISTRGFVGSGDDLLIGGFIVGPTTRVVVRAIGPSLGNAGIAGSLQDPTLQLVNASGDVLRSNDDWKSTQRAELEAIGIQPSDDRESALIATLTAGNYTAVVGGVGSNSGVGLVEVYNLP